MRRAPAALAATLALAAPAAAYAPGSPPKLCSADYFADVIGTPHADDLTGTGRVERLYGLGGDDRLHGSPYRLSCLIGGEGDDLALIGKGGGIAFGEAGEDRLRGGRLDDQLYGGAGRDAYWGAGGDDKLETRDGVAEVVDCGDGNDLATADRTDLLMSCETVLVDGPSNPTAAVRPPVGRARGPIRISLTAPSAGTYQAILTTDALGRDCGDGPLVVGRRHRVRAGRMTMLLHPPRHGWCRGTSKAGVVLARGGATGMPVARVEFTTR